MSSELAARATAAVLRDAAIGGARPFAVPTEPARAVMAAALRLAAARRPRPGQIEPASLDGDAELTRLRQVVRLYQLVLGTVPDRPGLRHNTELLAAGGTLEDLASSLLIASGPAATDRLAAAGALWRRAGGAANAFEPAWRRATGLPAFVAALARHPPRRAASRLEALFPAGIDPRHDDVAPAWGYRFWAAEIDARLSVLAGQVEPLLRLFGPTIVLTLRVPPTATAAQLDATLAGLSRQSYGRWRLVLVGAPPPGWTAPRDPRIVADVPGRALRVVLHGVLQAGDVPAPACLALFALAALRRPSVSRWSCDHDRIDGQDRRSQPRLDRDGGLVLHRAATDRASTRRVSTDPASTDPASAGGRHLPAVLLHRHGEPVPRRPAPVPRHCLPAGSVSLVIATRDRPALLRRCLDSIRATTAELRPQLVIVDNGTSDPEALSILSACAAAGGVVLRRPGPFNWSALCNEGVRASAGAIVVLMNNDVECLRPGWLGALADACGDPSVGVVGARLLYADGRVQHAGVLLGPGPTAAHRLADLSEDGCGDRPVTAVTGACMAFRRSLFDRLGGLEEALPVTWNDIDFCLRARAAGHDVRLVSGCVLRHHELGTRTPDDRPENRAQLARELALVSGRHRRALRRDRFLHPLLLLGGGGRLLDPAAPARIERLLRRGGVD